MSAFRSCHTAIVDGYVVEGHVPVEDMDRLLAERLEITGIAVAGMPIGSPGMDQPRADPHPTELFLIQYSYETDPLDRHDWRLFVRKIRWSIPGVFFFRFVGTNQR